MDDLTITETWQANAVYKCLKDSSPPSDDIIPDGIRAISRTHGGYSFILEIEPGVHNVMWAGRQRRLSMPYIIFVGQVLDACSASTFGIPATFLKSIGTFFRNEPIKSFDDPVCYAVLMNCFGHAMCGASGQLSNSSLKEAANFLRQSLFAKAYNYDSLSATNYAAFAHPKSQHTIKHLSKALYPIDVWEENSLKDPKFGLKLKWPRAHVDLRRGVGNQHAAENYMNHIFVSQELAKLQQT